MDRENHHIPSKSLGDVEVFTSSDALGDMKTAGSPSENIKVQRRVFHRNIQKQLQRDREKSERYASDQQRSGEEHTTQELHIVSPSKESLPWGSLSLNQVVAIPGLSSSDDLGVTQSKTEVDQESPQGKHGPSKSALVSVPLRQEFLKLLNDHSRLRLNAWLMDDKDIIFYRINFSTPASNPSSTYSLPLTGRSSRLPSSRDGISNSDMTEMTSVRELEPELKEQGGNHQPSSAHTVRAAGDDFSVVSNGRTEEETPTKHHRERLLSIFQRGDALLQRLHQLARGAQFDRSITDIIVDFRTLCMDYKPLPYTQISLAGQSSTLKAQDNQNQEYLNAGSTDRTHGNPGKQPIRGYEKQSQDQPLLASQISSKREHGKLLRCPHYFGADQTSAFCQTLHKYPTHLLRHLKAHRFYFCVECSLCFIGDTAKSDFDSHVHNYVCVALHCAHRGMTGSAHLRRSDCPSLRQMSTEQKWQSWFVLALPQEPIPDWSQVYIDPAETAHLVVEHSEREPLRSSVNEDAGFDWPEPSGGDVHMATSDDGQIADEGSPRIWIDNAFVPTVPQAQDVPGSTNGLRQQLSILQTSIDQQASAFAELVEQNRQQNLLILQMQQQNHLLNRSVLQMAQEVQEIRNAAARELGSGFPISTLANDMEDQFSSWAPGFSSTLENIAQQPVYGSDGAMMQETGDSATSLNADDSTQADAESPRCKVPYSTQARDSGYGSAAS